ncbi:MAG: hypothetical protein QXT45_04560 [Candidatus Bilamarchaeaceae archaeon]
MIEIKGGLSKVISYTGIAVGIFGIAIIVWLFFVFNGLIDSIHQTIINQVDSTISMLQHARIITNSTAASVDSLGMVAANTSSALTSYASALEGVALATSSLAHSLGMIPYMPQEVITSMSSSADSMSNAAGFIIETAVSMETTSGTITSTSLGFGTLMTDIDVSIANMEQTKENINNIYLTAKTGLILFTILLILVFVLNILSFYRQLMQ